MVVCRSLLLALLTAACVEFSTGRAVNISSVWLLPEEGFPVFYRYFKDRITWFEADAVCQFHHANLVTVDSSEQYDATRAYLKELDVLNNVWVGLKRSRAEGEFTWTDYKPLENGGYWQEQIPLMDNPVCAALDPAADYRWHPLKCGGPEVASFICQLEVPSWARKEDGCMLTSLPSLTVTYLPEQGAVELISDCGLEGTRRIACKGQANRDEMMKQLSCETSTEGQTEATSSNTWSDNEVPTRHRRDTDVTVDMTTVHHLVPTTEGLTEVNSVEVTNDSPPAEEQKENMMQTTSDSDITSTQGLPQEMSAAEEPIKSAVPVDITNDKSDGNKIIVNIITTAGNFTGQATEDKDLLNETPIQIPLNSISRITSDESGSTETKKQPEERRVVAVQSKPIPPSLRGNTPFIEPANKTETEKDHTVTPKPVEKESHEVFRESKSDILLKAQKQDVKAVNFPPLSVYKVNKDGEPDESSSRIEQTPAKNVDPTSAAHTTPAVDKTEIQESSDSKFFTRVVVDEITQTTHQPDVKVTAKSNTDNDFFIATESPVKSAEISIKVTEVTSSVVTEQKNEKDLPGQDPNGDLSKPSSLSDQEMADEAEPEAPERPNRGRLLIRPQHHSFYPYFFNRVLG
ncbi:uncharacterized protein LOC129001168 [Macrosteles quadrilineatus]|uniref:uncharacterized protein LOC129001168 n=1 Tax=Macrosteles quadrilineatus TaxID=74068 RepID=UPI0023E09B7C|nr:uncharacterized protein LOC129001168 [Macrosteles quadrilineatus]